MVQATQTGGFDRAAEWMENERTPIEAVPESLDAAEHEYRDCATKIRDIQAQLAQPSGPIRDGVRLTRDAYAEWRGKAIWAITVTQRRQAFLKTWIKDRRRESNGVYLSAARSMEEISASAMARVLSKRIGQLESVYVASLNMLDADTPDTRADWLRRLETARETLGDFRDQSEGGS